MLFELHEPGRNTNPIMVQVVEATIAYELCDEEFGQRHFMLVDPDGNGVDLYAPLDEDA